MLQFIKIKLGDYKKEKRYRLIINIIWWIISIIGLIYLYYNNMISIRRIENWFIILFIIIIYILILKGFQWYVSARKNPNFYEKDEYGNLKKFDRFDEDIYIFWRRSFKDRKSKEFQNIKNKWIKKIKIALFLSKIINPIFWLLLQINIRLIFFCRWFNWKFEKYINFRKLIYFLFLYCINYPILIIFWFYYRMINKWKWEPFYKSFFRRISGWFVAIIWITILGEELYFFYREKEIYFLFLLYLILIVVSINHKYFFKLNQHFDIRFINILDIRIRSTGLGSIIGISHKYQVLLEETVKDYYAFEGSLGSNRKFLMYLSIIPISVLTMMNEVKYKPCYKYYSFINSHFNIYISNNLYYAKKIYKNELNKKLANEYYELYFFLLKDLIFMKLDILKFSLQNNNVDDWIYIDEEYNMICFKDYSFSCGDNYKEKFFELAKIYNIKEKFLDLSENIDYFSKNIWFWDLDIRYKIMGWQEEIEEILKEENIEKYIIDEELKKEKNLEWKNKINSFINEWKEKNSNK